MFYFNKTPILSGYFKYSLIFSSIMFAGMNNSVEANNDFYCQADSDNNDLVVCTVPRESGDFTANFVDDILPLAQKVDGRINDNTAMWIQAWGGDGGNGGGSSCRGERGLGGYAQLETRIQEYYYYFGQYYMYYYLGSDGSNAHNSCEVDKVSSGTGGAATLVTLNIGTSEEGTLAIDDVLLLSGGGGGGGIVGNDGGAGGVAMSSLSSVSAAGDDAEMGSDGRLGGGGGNIYGVGIGGEGSYGSGNDGVGGRGGSVNYYYEDHSISNDQIKATVLFGVVGLVIESVVESGDDVVSTSGAGWSIVTPEVGDNGMGGSSSQNLSGGGGGGGYGGGGSGLGASSSNPDKSYTGGGGGGSWARASFRLDSLASASRPTNPNGSEGYVQFTFNAANNLPFSCVEDGDRSEGDEHIVTCLFDNTDYMAAKSDIIELANLALDLTAENAVIDGDTSAWISAYSGSGAGEDIDTSLTNTDAEMAGSRGYAQTQLTLNSMNGDMLYYYLGTSGQVGSGGKASEHLGGSATIVTTSELSDANSLSADNALLVAGGGGGAGQAQNGWIYPEVALGGNGGAGGIAIASYDVSASTTGEDGYSSMDGYQGYGGNSDGQGAGGVGGTGQDGAVNSLSSGTSGWGGNSGSLMDYLDGAYTDVDCLEYEGEVAWSNGTPSFDDTAGQGGAGLMATNEHVASFTCSETNKSDYLMGSFNGGTGGGGYGGGGGSKMYYSEYDTVDPIFPWINDTSYAGGAGGAGSYAAPATIADDAYQLTAVDILPTTGDGEVSITFHVTVAETVDE